MYIATKHELTNGPFDLLAPHQLYIPKPHVLKLLKQTENVTIDCYGYGKPLPSVVWKKDGVEVKNISVFSEAYNNQVVQVFDFSRSSSWNISSRLFLRTGGITYSEAGNYTCEVFNGVDTNHSEQGNIEVLCMYFICDLFINCVVASNAFVDVLSEFNTYLL